MGTPFFPRFVSVLSVTSAALLSACSASSGGGGGGNCLPGDIDCSSDLPAGATTKSDAWNSINDPGRWAYNLEYRYAELPESGRSERVAWASTYWPTYQDSSNVRWQGSDELSPMEKYDKAFNGWEPPANFMELRPLKSCGAEFDQEYYDNLGPAADYVTTRKGNLKMRDGVDNDADGEIDECMTSDSDHPDYDGIETWWGLCHAWVPAAILEPEAPGPVEVNGVTFEVSDLAALQITAYDRSNAHMLGGRCNAREVDRDEQTNRPVDVDCRDTNPGAFHVILGNYLGLRKQAFAEDRTYDFEVWNQPLVEYEVTSSRYLDAAGANEVLGETGPDYLYNDDAVEFVEVEVTSHYITESHASTEPTTDNIDWYTRRDYYHYILELDAEGKIIGGEWVGNSLYDHPDFLWLPTGVGYGNNPYIDLTEIRKMVQQAIDEHDVNDPPEGPEPASQCDGTYLDAGGRCRRENGQFAPAICCSTM